MDGLKIPPHCIDSEKGVLGSIMLDAEVALDKCINTGISAESFYSSEHRNLFEAIHEMQVDGKPVDPLTLYTHLKAKNAIQKVGGQCYLLELQNACYVPSHSEHYARVVVEKARRREIIASSLNVIDMAYGEDDVKSALAEIQSIGTESGEARTKPIIISDAKEMSDKMWKGISLGIPTPFEQFNVDTFGLPRGIVCPLAGRGGKGKSMVKAKMSEFLAMKGTPVLDLCLEDGDTKASMRVAACIGEYDLFRLNRGSVNDQYMETHNKCLDQLESIPYYPDQRSGTVEDIVIRIGKFVRENEAQIRAGGGIVWVDGIKDVVPSAGENKTTQEEHISSSLSRCAVYHRDITIIPITHLTKLDPEIWITTNNIRGSALQVANARACLILQDAGFDNEIQKMAGFDMEDVVVLEMAKTNYGNEGRVVLRKEFESGRFVEL